MHDSVLEPASEAATPVYFEDLGLPEPIVRAVREKGYDKPTAIQAEAIPVLLAGRDLIGGSQTGTGKTAAFALPILARLARHQKGGPRCLILEPTRELAQQVLASFQTYGKHLDLRVVLLHGGVGYGSQRDGLQAGADVIIATPGRLLDHLQQKALDFKRLEVLVLDEADRMLDMGFLPDVRRIIGLCPKERQSLFFSATIPPALERLVQTMLRDPQEIRIGGGRMPAETITHAIFPVDERQKFDLVVALLQRLEYHSVLIFTRTKHGADVIARWLETSGHGKVGVLHADRTQKERDQALADFKSGVSEILVATDIVARGIDISGVTHVINYDIPENPEDYVHRIGRTGRASREGDALTIYTARDTSFLQAIERFIKQKIQRLYVEDFQYAWSPIFDEDQPPKEKKRNRGYNNSVEYDWR